MKVTKYKPGEFPIKNYKLLEAQSINDKIIRECFVIEAKKTIPIDEYLLTLDKESDEYKYLYERKKNRKKIKDYRPEITIDEDTSVTKETFKEYYSQEIKKYYDKKLPHATERTFIIEKLEKANTYRDLSQGNKNLIEEWKTFLNNRLNELSIEPTGLQANKFSKENTDQPEIVELSQLFERISHYNYIITLLANDDNKLCDPITHVWNKKKGSRGHLIAILKDLNVKGYYKKEIITITNQTYRTIARNTFKKAIALETVNKAQPESFDLAFIPYATELP